MHITKKSPSGFTLVELMVVVAIVGILAAMGSIGYSRYIRAAQMEELEQVALEVASGQQRFRSRQNAFYPLAGGTRDWASSEAQIKALLEVRNQLPPDVRVQIFSWLGGGGGPAMCGFCNGLGDTTNAGFLIGVQRDFDDAPSSTDPMVIVTDNMRPVRLFDGNN